MLGSQLPEWVIPVVVVAAILVIVMTLSILFGVPEIRTKVFPYRDRKKMSTRNE